MTFKGKEIEMPPTLAMVAMYIWKKRMNVSARKIHKKYEANGRMGTNGQPVKTLEAAINGCNSFPEKYKREKDDVRVEYHSLLETEEWMNYRKKVVDFYGETCRECGAAPYRVIHHKHYHFKGEMGVPAKLSWEYSMEEVVPVCDACHKKLHHVEYKIL